MVMLCYMVTCTEDVYKTCHWWLSQQLSSQLGWSVCCWCKAHRPGHHQVAPYKLRVKTPQLCATPHFSINTGDMKATVNVCVCVCRERQRKPHKSVVSREVNRSVRPGRIRWDIDVARGSIAVTREITPEAHVCPTTSMFSVNTQTRGSFIRRVSVPRLAQTHVSAAGQT